MSSTLKGPCRLPKGSKLARLSDIRLLFDILTWCVLRVAARKVLADCHLRALPFGTEIPYHWIQQATVAFLRSMKAPIYLSESHLGVRILPKNRLLPPITACGEGGAPRSGAVSKFKVPSPKPGYPEKIPAVSGCFHVFPAISGSGEEKSVCTLAMALPADEPAARPYQKADSGTVWSGFARTKKAVSPRSLAFARFRGWDRGPTQRRRDAEVLQEGQVVPGAKVVEGGSNRGRCSWIRARERTPSSFLTLGDQGGGFCNGCQDTHR